MSSWFYVAKSGEVCIAPLFRVAKNEDSIILRGKDKVCIAPSFCGAKSALLHNFAGQRMVKMDPKKIVKYVDCQQFSDQT